jgi:dTDP-4-dehydrorhamnose 3,5-epimerase
MVGEFYAPDLEGGLRHDDARLGIAWPLPVGEMSEKDRAWRPLSEIEPELRRRMALA